MPVDIWTMMARILLAAALGLLIGLERERHARAAGLRTCLLVAMAGALIMSLSLHLAQLFGPEGADSIVRMDPSRLAAYAIAGMGFLGAGSIIQGRRSARGVTTGAAMWACTVVGLAVGAGLYLPALLVVAITLVALMLLRRPARLVRQEQYVTLRVEGPEPSLRLRVSELLASHGARIQFVGRERCRDSGDIAFTYSLVIHPGSQWAELLDRLEGMEGLNCYSWQQAEVP
jgi:putative Mg2+ transporter-C (MgtC) family protein